MANLMPHKHDSVTLEATQTSNNDDVHIIQIPSSSFTAFRLLYASPSEIAHLASTVLLGKIPDAWTKVSNKPTIFCKKSPSRPSTRKWISSTTIGVKARLNKYTRFGSAGLETVEPTARNAEVSMQQMISSENWDESSTGTFSSVDNFDSQDSGYPSPAGEVSDNLDSQGLVSAQQSASTPDEPKAMHKDSDISSKISKVLIESGSSKLHQDSGNSANLFSEQTDLHLENERVYVFSSKFSSGEGKRSTSITSAVQETDLESQIQDKLLASKNMRKPGEPPLLQTPSQLKFRPSLKTKTGNSSRGFDHSDSKKLKVQFANPHPEEELSTDHLKKEYIKAEREHYRAIRKMQSLAQKSKGRARKSTSKLKLKVVDSILRRRKAGDIIRVDKMLVMIKKTYGITSMPTSAENSGFNTLIQDHWREYYVVLRKTGDSMESVRIQLFEANKGKNFSGKPEHFIDLSKATRASFCSHTDKTITIANLVDDGLKTITLNAKYITVAYRWLYVIKEIIDDDFLSTIKMNLAGAGGNTQIRINIPNALLQKLSFKPQFMNVFQHSHGCTVENDFLLTYLRAKIDSRLRSIVNGHGETKDWMKQNSHPAFCFKFYDRIEWVPIDGKSLLFQSQLLRDDAILEYRQVTKVPLSTESTTGKTLARPLQIEGFLSRITNISGKEFSKFRALYKIQYFFSSENLLFFSSFFRGIPPSPHNELSKEGADRQALCNSLPDVYLRNPFELNSHGHINWLQSGEFERFDNEAVEEFSRKLQQIVSARAMVDLSMVSAVRPIPFETISKRHLHFQSYLWYSNPKIIDDMSIMDSGFEIELFNHSRIKLLAPSRSIRDEWVKRLTEIASYWKAQISHSTKGETSSKFDNMANLRSEDYVDSNLTFGPDSLETRYSTANVDAFTTSGLAMSTCVLCSGYLYQKQKKHANFSRYFVVLCPGYLLIFSLFKRSKVTGVWRDTPYFERYMTIPISECYVYSEASTQLDLVGSQKIKSPGEFDLPRVYPDGWRSSEEEFMRCFSIWFGGKRALRHGARYSGLNSVQGSPAPKNPGMVHMACKSGVTGKILVFLARSRQEREHWVYNILQEINRFSVD